MSATVIIPQSTVLTGLAVVLGAATAPATGGDKFLNDGRIVVDILNGSAAPITVTCNSLVNCNQGHDHNVSVTVNAGVRKLIGPFPSQRFNDSDGYCTVLVSLETTVTLAAVKMPG